MRSRSCRASARSAGAILAAGLLRDPDAQVRLAALLSLADQPPSDEAARPLAVALRGGLATNDRWLADAATAAAARNDLVVLEGACRSADSEPAGGPACLRSPSRVAEHWARGGPAESGSAPCWRRLPGGEPAVNEAILRGHGPRLAQGPAGPARRSDRRGASSKLTIELDPGARGATGPAGRRLGQPGPRRHRRRDRRVAAGYGQERAALRVAPHRCRPAAHRAPGAATIRRAASCSDLITPRDVARAGRRPGRRRRRQQGARVRRSAGRRSCPSSSPGVRSRVLRVLLGRSDWIPALVDRSEHEPGPALRAGARPEAGPGRPPQRDDRRACQDGCSRRAAACPTPTGSR